MDCRRVKKSLMDYVDGGLSETGREEVSRHLESCQDCSALAEKLTISASALSTLEPANMPQQASRRVLGALNSPGKAPRAVGFLHSPSALAAAGGAVAVLVALAIVVSVFTLGGPGKTPQVSKSTQENPATSGIEGSQTVVDRFAAETTAVTPATTLVLPVAKITKNNYDKNSAKTMVENLEVKNKFAERYGMSDVINLRVTFTKKLADDFTTLGGDGATLEAMISFILATESVLLPCYVEKAQFAGENVYIVGLSGPPRGGNTNKLTRTEFWAFKPDKFSTDPEASLAWWGQSIKQ